MVGPAEVQVGLVSGHPLWGHILYPAAIAMSRFLELHSSALLRGDRQAESKGKSRAKNVLELGAGGGLPGLVAALEGAANVVISDFPDPSLVNNLAKNVKVNVTSAGSPSVANTVAEGYTWGSSPSTLLSHLPTGEAFDLILLSDLVFNHSQHSALLDSCLACLSPLPTPTDTTKTPYSPMQPDIDLSTPETLATPALLCFYSHHRPTEELIAADLGFLTTAKAKGWKVERVWKDTGAGPAFPEDAGDLCIRGTSATEHIDTMTANSKGEPRAKKPATTTTKAKATATTKGKKKGAAGKLSAFMNVPLDILAEICTHLTPLDLIRLASLSKAFRALLVHSNNCNSIWIRARKQFGLPALQANQALGGMSEWQYAYLVFVKKCHDCNATCHVADFYLRTRLCKSCRKKRIDWYSDHASYNFIKDAHPDLRKCLATSPYSASNWKKEGSLPNVLKADAHFINDQLWEKYREDEATKAKSKSKKETVGNGPLVAKFVEERVALVVKIKSDAKAIQETLTKFEEEEKNAKADKKISDDIIISTRRIAIRQKVMALGYAWSDTNSELWNKSPLVNKAEPLTDDGWKKEKPKIVKLLEKIKESREVEQAAYAKRVRQGRIQTPYYRLKSTEADNARKDYPRFGDFLQLPTVKKFWESSSKSFVQAEWDSQLDKIKNEVDDHREKVRINAIRTILAASQKVDMNTLSTNPRLYPSSKYDDAFFELATSGLFCSLPDCRAKGSFSIDYWDDISDYGYFSDDDFPSPQISYNRPRLVHFSSLSSLLDHQQSYHSEHRPDELIHGHFELPKLCADGVKEMIKLLQLTPATAKIDELEKRGTYFHWTNGANSKKGKWWDTKPLLDAWHHKATGARGRNVDHEAPVITLHTLDLPPKAAPADGKNA